MDEIAVFLIICDNFSTLFAGRAYFFSDEIKSETVTEGRESHRSFYCV